MGNWTPGPWVTGKQCPLVFGAARGAGMEPIGFIYAPALSEDSEIGKRAAANARLIAAAPELLEACLLARHICEDGSALQQQIDAAIAKATGGNP